MDLFLVGVAVGVMVAGTYAVVAVHKVTGQLARERTRIDLMVLAQHERRVRAAHQAEWDAMVQEATTRRPAALDNFAPSEDEGAQVIPAARASAAREPRTEVDPRLKK